MKMWLMSLLLIYCALRGSIANQSLIFDEHIPASRFTFTIGSYLTSVSNFGVSDSKDTVFSDLLDPNNPKIVDVRRLQAQVFSAMHVIILEVPDYTRLVRRF